MHDKKTLTPTKQSQATNTKNNENENETAKKKKNYFLLVFFCTKPIQMKQQPATESSIFM